MDCSLAISNMESRISDLTQQIADLDATIGTGINKPNRTSEGVDVDYVGYRKSLTDEIDSLTATIIKLRDTCEGPYMDVMYG